MGAPRVDLYHLYRHLHFTNLAFPLALGALRTWAEKEGWRGRVITCRESRIDLDNPPPVVGISVYTQTAPAAYRLGERLRQKGTIVVLGGPHFRKGAAAAEADGCCDVVASGICREQWIGLLRDIAAGRIGPGRRRPLYIEDADGRFRYPDRMEGLSAGRKWYQIPSVPTSLGCPYDCGFCSPYGQGAYHLRDPAVVRDEIAAAGGNFLLLCDATFGLHRSYTRRLMDEIAPLGRKIIVETTLARLGDDTLLDAMASGGVKYIIVGIETFSGRLRKHGTVAAEEAMVRLIGRVHDRGMMIQGNMICGLDEDGPDSFERIARFHETSGIDQTMIGILTPYPATRLYDRLRSEGRIIDDDWEHYDCHHVVYRPSRMTIRELVDGYNELYRSLAGTRSTLSQLLRTFRRNGCGREVLGLQAFRLYSWCDARRKKRTL